MFDGVRCRPGPLTTANGTVFVLEVAMLRDGPRPASTGERPVRRDRRSGSMSPRVSTVAFKIATLCVRSQAATVWDCRRQGLIAPDRGTSPVHRSLGRAVPPIRPEEFSDVTERVRSPSTAPPQADSEGNVARPRTIPEASVARLAVYLRMLGELVEQGAETVSSEELAAATGVNSAKLRKDLSYIGSYGIRGVGYEVNALLLQLERVLGLNHRQAVALVGVGNLGHALAGYTGFGGRGFPVTALFDVDPDLVGIHINGILVEHVDAIPAVCAERGVTIGMIATPGPAAQAVCDTLVTSGVRCILNFAPVVLQVPAEVEVRKVDLAVELQVLAFHVARRHVAEHVPGVNGHSVNGHTNGHASAARSVPLMDGSTEGNR